MISQIAEININYSLLVLAGSIASPPPLGIHIMFGLDSHPKPYFTWEATTWCVKHQAYCEAKSAELNISGSPCVAWSTMGTRAGANGVTLLCFMTWVYQRLLLEESAILHENTPEFNSELLVRMLGHKYEVMSLVPIEPMLLVCQF